MLLIFMQNVVTENAIMQNDILQNFVMHSVIMQNAIFPNAIMQNDIFPNVIMQNAIMGVLFCLSTDLRRCRNIVSESNYRWHQFRQRSHSSASCTAPIKKVIKLFSVLSNATKLECLSLARHLRFSRGLG
jgi:hypothetical protein